MNQNTDDLLKKYYTARIDIKNHGKNNKIIILSNNDSNAEISQPKWFNNDNGIGTIISSCEGTLNLKIKCVNEGLLKIHLRTLDIRDIYGKRFPIYIDYTHLSVNEKIIFKKSELVWHDQPYTYAKHVYDSEIIDIHIKWMPFNSSSEYKITNSPDLVQSLKNKLAIREEQIKSIHQLSYTTLGFPALNGKIIYRNYNGIHSNTLLDDFNGYCDNIWFTRYLKHKFPDEDYKINIFGVFNPHDNLAYPMNGKKVLYSMEDLNYRFLEMKFNFDTYALDYVDFAMGYDIIDNPKYLRFPFWIIRHISPESTEEDIEKKIEKWNSTTYNKTKDVSAIASHDWAKTRTLITETIEKYINITYAGKWKNNSTELYNKYNNDKFSFLKSFKFNVCAENLLVDGYVTEKIFDAINCDCIPLYAGGGNYLEPEIINHDAIIRWDGKEQYNRDPEIEKNATLGRYARYQIEYYAEENQNSDTIELFKNIIHDEKTYNEFKDQDKVLDSSAKYIINILSNLEKHFEQLIYS